MNKTISYKESTAIAIQAMISAARKDEYADRKRKSGFPQNRKKRDVTLKDVREWNKRRNYKEGCRNCRQCNDGVSYQRPLCGPESTLQILRDKTMATTSFDIQLPHYSRGFHLITRDIISQLPALPESGLLVIFIKHTSAGLTINENADPDVRHDFQTFFNKLVPDGAPYFIHTLEGPDDMSAHIKASLIGSSVTIPIKNHRLNLGTWQGVYLCEFRDGGDTRKLSITIL